MKTNRYSIMAKLTLTVSVFVILLSACSPDNRNVEVSEVLYYYRANGVAVVNDHIERPVGTEGAVSDYYTANGNSYFIGTKTTKVDTVNKDGYPCTMTVDQQAFVEINGVRQWYKQNNHLTKGTMIVPDGKDVYFIFEEIYETGDTDQLGNPHHGTIYHASKNGEPPVAIAHNQEEIYNTRLPIITNIKKLGDTFYFTGIRSEAGFYCSAADLHQPFYVTGYNGAVFDVAKKDDVIYCCGRHEDRAYVFNKTELIELELPEGCTFSEARCMKVVGNDLYVGGRINNNPVIWKNGKIYGEYTEFPPHYTIYFIDGVVKGLFGPIAPNTDNHPNKNPAFPFNYESGSVATMEIVGNTIYSVVMTRSIKCGSVIDCRYFALEWNFTESGLKCKYDYDIVEMMKLRKIVFDAGYYPTGEAGEEMWTLWQLDEKDSHWNLYYSDPRISLRYVKARRKK